MKHQEISDRIHRLVGEIVDESPEHQRSFLPISTSMMIVPKGTVEITARPQLPFRGDRLAIRAADAEHFTIDAIRVGTRAIGVSAGSIPADVYATRLDLLPVLDAKLEKDGFVHIKITKKAEELFGEKLALPRMMTGTDFTIYVTNTSDKPWTFCAALLGAIDGDCMY